MTGFCILEPLPTKDSGLLAETLVCALAPYRNLLHTVTSDNGKEFAAHREIAKAHNVGYYFARSYLSWERGANENLNGLERGLSRLSSAQPRRTSFPEYDSAFTFIVFSWPIKSNSFDMPKKIA